MNSSQLYITTGGAATQVTGLKCRGRETLQGVRPDEIRECKPRAPSETPVPEEPTCVSIYLFNQGDVPTFLLS